MVIAYLDELANPSESWFHNAEAVRLLTNKSRPHQHHPPLRQSLHTLFIHSIVNAVTWSYSFLSDLNPIQGTKIFFFPHLD